MTCSPPKAACPTAFEAIPGLSGSEVWRTSRPASLTRRLKEAARLGSQSSGCSLCCAAAQKVSPSDSWPLSTLSNRQCGQGSSPLGAIPCRHRSAGTNATHHRRLYHVRRTASIWSRSDWCSAELHPTKSGRSASHTIRAELRRAARGSSWRCRPSNNRRRAPAPVSTDMCGSSLRTSGNFVQSTYLVLSCRINDGKGLARRRAAEEALYRKGMA